MEGHCPALLWWGLGKGQTELVYGHYGFCEHKWPHSSSTLFSSLVTVNVWLSGSHAISHELHWTKQMHLFSQLEEFDNMRTRVNSLANLRQAGPSLSCQLRPFILSPLQCTALSLTLYLLFYTVLFHSIQFFHIVFCAVCYYQCCYSLVYPVLLSSHYVSHHSSLTELLFSCVLSNNELSIYSQH